MAMQQSGVFVVPEWKKRVVGVENRCCSGVSGLSR